MIRVGFIQNRANDSWLGGLNYLKNLLLAIRSMPTPLIEPILITSPKGFDKLSEEFPNIEIITTNLIDKKTPAGFITKCNENIFGKNYFLESFLKRNNIAVISHTSKLGPRSKFPNLFWIPDFQHKRRPDFFNVQEIARRDQMQRKAIDQSDLIILSSFDAQNDMRQYFPDGVAKSAVLHFVSGLAPDPSKLRPLAELETTYGFRAPYFHLPNQFWTHKNHGLVVDALSVLKAHGHIVTVISTGHTVDDRHPEYFGEFQSTLISKGLKSQFRILGVVPYDDVSSLMYHAIGVINPSFFEGWSTTVEESKSIGKAILLSDIPVHREQAPERGSYFNPYKSEELVALMLEHITSFNKIKEETLVKAATINNKKLFVAFGEAYQLIILNSFQTLINHQPKTDGIKRTKRQ